MSSQKKKTNTGDKNASSQAAQPAQQTKPKTQNQQQQSQQQKQQGKQQGGQQQGGQQQGGQQQGGQGKQQGKQQQAGQQGKQQQQGGQGKQQQQGQQGQQGQQKQKQAKQTQEAAPKNVEQGKGKGQGKQQQQQGKQQGGQGKQQGKQQQQGKQTQQQQGGKGKQQQQQQQGGQGKQQQGKQQQGKQQQGQQGQQGKQQKKKAQTQVKSAKQGGSAGGAKKKTQGKQKSASTKKGASKKKETERGFSKTKGGSKKKTATKGRTAGGKKSGKGKKTADGKTKSKFRLRNSRQQGRQTGNSKLWDKLRPTEDDVLKMLAAQVHVGPARCHANMQRYVFKRRKDGLHIINLDKSWHKMVLAARILAAVQNPADIMVMSTRTYGQRGAIKFAQYIGATALVGKWIPGTFCNPQNKAYAEPRLLLVDDPATCFAALRETSYVGIPVIALAGVNNNTRFVDCAVPCNNRGKFSLGLLFWLLAREVLRIKNEIPRTKPWEVAVDLFFYRDPDKIKKAQEEKARKQEQQEYGTQAPEYYEPQYGGAADTYQPTGDFGIENLQSSWEQEPPQHVLEDWAAADVMMDAPYQAGYAGEELEAVHPYQPQEQYEEQQYYTTEEQAFGTVHMQQW